MVLAWPVGLANNGLANKILGLQTVGLQTRCGPADGKPAGELLQACKERLPHRNILDEVPQQALMLDMSRAGG